MTSPLPSSYNKEWLFPRYKSARFLREPHRIHLWMRFFNGGEVVILSPSVLEGVYALKEMRYRLILRLRQIENTEI
jgi:hypothetical protein